jgi:hypothetical protein
MTYSLSKFSVHFGNELATDASQLRLNPGHIPAEMDIKSDSTGTSYTFKLSKKLPWGNGWVYVPRDKKCPCPSVTIYND